MAMPLPMGFMPPAKRPSLFERLLGSLSNPTLAGIGLQTLGGLISTRSERRRQRELREQSLGALEPLETERRQLAFGPSMSEGRMIQGETSRTLADLSSRGVLDSSFAASDVAGAVAPFEAQRKRELQSVDQQLAAAKQAIAQGTSLPGFGAAFGGALGDIGGFLALRGGVEEGRKRGKKSRTDRLLDLMEQSEEME